MHYHGVIGVVYQVISRLKITSGIKPNQSLKTQFTILKLRAGDRSEIQISIENDVAK